MRPRRRQPSRASWTQLDSPQSLNSYIDATSRRYGTATVPLTWFNTLLGIILIPFFIVTVETLWVTLAQATVYDSFWRTPQFWFFTLGIAIWIPFYFGFRGPKMVYLYVFGHEWTHAICALLCGGKLLRRPYITSSGGEVVTNKNNLFISLSPYLIPFYSVIVGVGFWALQWFVDVGPVGERFFFGAMGFTLAYHLTFTVRMSLRTQPDLEQNGVFFSLVFILFINLLVLAALFVFAAPTVEWGPFLSKWWETVRNLGPRMAALMG